MQRPKESITLSVNGKPYTLEVVPNTPLMYVLRNELGLNGPKYGCGFGQCGACMVLLDDRAVTSCVLPVQGAQGKEVVTLAGLAEKGGTLHPVQQAFLEEEAAQCSYCTNGMVMAAVALLKRNPQPDDAAIRQALQGNLCRCGTQSRVIRAIRKAAKM